MNSNFTNTIRKASIILIAVTLATALFFPLRVIAAEDVKGLDAAIAGISELIPGDETIIQVSVQNNKTIDKIDSLAEQADLAQYYGYAVGLTASLEKGNAPVTIKTEKILLGTLPMGTATQPLPFVVEVDEDATPGTYQLNLTLTYTELSEVKMDDTTTGQFVVTWADKAETTVLDIDIEDKQTSEFEITDIEASLHSGARSEVKVTFRNSGDNTILDSVARLSDAVAPLHLTDDTAFLGIIEPGDTAVGIFELKVDGNALEKIYSLNAEIKYSNEEGEEYISEVIKVPVEVSSNAARITEMIINNMISGLVGAGIVAAIFLTSFLIRRRKRKKLD
jgi:hypothetical protein